MPPQRRWPSSRTKAWWSVSDDIRLTLAEGVPLAHAMVDRIAVDHGIRALLIKGPVLELQGLRQPRQSGDVDVMCEPSRVDELTDALQHLGWEVFNEDPVTPRVLPAHGYAYTHERWPCAIDLHRTFPGFFAPAEDVFDALWSHRTSVELAGQSVTCTDIIASAAVHGLHLLREPLLELSESDLDDLVSALRRLEDTELRELAELTAATGSADTLAPIMDRLDAPPIGRGQLSPEDRAEWGLRTTAGTTQGLLWIEEVRRQPVRRWPGVIWRALTFDEDELFLGDSRARSGWLATCRLVARRTWKALRSAPGALRAHARTRRDG
jgi:hypothetical protein